MKKKFDLERLFSQGELIALQSLITQGIESVYVNNEDFIYYNKQNSYISCSFKPKLLVKFSSGQYLFRNDAIVDKFQEFVSKVAFVAYNTVNTNTNDEYNKILELNFFIDHIDVYSTYREAFQVDYCDISDTLIVLVSDTGKKIGIAADEEFQDSILFWYDTEMIETILLFYTLNDRTKPKFHKRVIISYDEIAYL